MNDAPSMMVDINGIESWLLYGELHRIDGPALTYPDGSKYWYQYGMFHREGGPAHITQDGSEFWYLNDQRHRIDGPAVIYSNGVNRWYIRGELILTWSRYQELTGMPDEELSVLILKYGNIK